MVREEISKSKQLRSCILVLGARGFGTSTMAGVVAALGADAPASVLGVDSFESGKISDLNDALLASAGSAWDDFTPFHLEWLQSPKAAEFLDRALAILEEEFGKSQLFVLTDPTICRLLPFWRVALDRFGCEAKPVLIAGDPLDVSPMLRSARNISKPLAQMIWLRSMLDAEYGTRGLARLHMTFEQLVQDWGALTRKARMDLDLVWPKSAASAEFDVARLLTENPKPLADISHHESAGALLPEWMLETHAVLRRWAEDGESTADCQRLDQIKAEFDIASNAFGRVIRADRDGRGRSFAGIGSTEATDAESLKSMLQEQRRKVTLMNADLVQQIEAREAVESQLIEAHNEVAATRARRKEMARVIANREVKIVRLNQELDARYQELAILQRQLVRYSPSWWAKSLRRRVIRLFRRPVQNVYS